MNNGLLTRTAYTETPPKMGYELTLLRQELRGALEAMCRWGNFLFTNE
ncbi:winged helix-turn-helix transcriptional regulator [Pseudomonas alliivorans]